MGCQFCKNICSVEEYQDRFEWPDYEEPAIVLDYEDNGYGLYIPVADYYYSGIYLTINYCPICGRKLKGG